MRLFLGVTGCGLRGELVDIAEARAGESVEVLRLDPLGCADFARAQPRRTRGDPA